MWGYFWLVGLSPQYIIWTCVSGVEGGVTIALEWKSHNVCNVHESYIVGSFCSVCQYKRALWGYFRKSHNVQTPKPHNVPLLSRSVCLSVLLSVCLPACWSACLSVCLSVYLCILPSVYLSVTKLRNVGRIIFIPSITITQQLLFWTDQKCIRKVPFYLYLPPKDYASVIV